ncbi:hypothetical protein [Rickettsia endosymbiont of Polydrusus tereticollis]
MTYSTFFEPCNNTGTSHGMTPNALQKIRSTQQRRLAMLSITHKSFSLQY